MDDKYTFRQTLLRMLAAYFGLSFKQLGARCGMTERNVSHHLTRKRRRDDLKDDVFERLLGAFGCSPAAVSAVAECIETLAAIEAAEGLSPEELAEIAEAGRGSKRLTWEGLSEVARRTRAVPIEGYPEPNEVEPARRQAERLLRRLAELPPSLRLAVVRVADRYQSWALCENACETSEREASRDLERAAVWASVAREIAAKARGPEWWRHRVRGFAAGFGANVLRVKGELPLAEAEFVTAKGLWLAGADPLGLLDPGRILDLEASLLRAQRRFAEALARLDEAIAVGRSPERALVKKGFTLEAMGDYERAIETLTQAEPQVDRSGDPRLAYMLSFNLAVSYTHVGRFSEAAELAQRVLDLALAQGDETQVHRVVWLRGRIQGGLGNRHEARALLAQARREFDARGMSYDVALGLLEEAVLLLEEKGREAEVKRLAWELGKVFASKGVHREALAALSRFREAAERDEATLELARRVLRFLFRARHDQGLRFES